MDAAVYICTACVPAPAIFGNSRPYMSRSVNAVTLVVFSRGSPRGCWRAGTTVLATTTLVHFTSIEQAVVHSTQVDQRPRRSLLRGRCVLQEITTANESARQHILPLHGFQVTRTALQCRERFTLSFRYLSTALLSRGAALLCLAGAKQNGCRCES